MDFGKIQEKLDKSKLAVTKKISEIEDEINEALTNSNKSLKKSIESERKKSLQLINGLEIELDQKNSRSRKYQNIIMTAVVILLLLVLIMQSLLFWQHPTSQVPERWEIAESRGEKFYRIPMREAEIQSGWIFIKVKEN